jgi:hypothetical protein
VLHGGRSCYDPEISLLLYDCVVGLVKEHIAAWHTAFEAAQAIAKRAGAAIDGVLFQAIVQVVHADDLRGDPILFAATCLDFEEFLRLVRCVMEFVRDLFETQE